MQWNDYALSFRAKALSARRDDGFIDGCLKYAANLFHKGLPVIYDQKHLAALLGVEYNYLLSVSNKPQAYYKTSFIKKKYGAYRRIEAPNYYLKEIQRWILSEILSKLPVGLPAKAYVKGIGIKDNAQIHKGQTDVLRLDIKDFFPSITSKMIYEIFRRAGYSKALSTILSKLCTLNRHLPQGAPSSPALSNLVFSSIDKRFDAFAKKKAVNYSRYADDLVFSGQLNVGQILFFCRKVLAEHGFVLNEKKTRLMQAHQRQIVTGLVVNQGVNVPREVKRKLRQEAYYTERFGRESHMERLKCDKTLEEYYTCLTGKICFAAHVNPQCSVIKKCAEIIG